MSDDGVQLVNKYYLLIIYQLCFWQTTFPFPIMSMLQPILFFKVMKWSINFKTFSVIILHKKYQTFIITGMEQAIGNQKTEIPIAPSITITTFQRNLSTNLRTISYVALRSQVYSSWKKVYCNKAAFQNKPFATCFSSTTAVLATVCV